MSVILSSKDPFHKVSVAEQLLKKDPEKNSVLKCKIAFTHLQQVLVLRPNGNDKSAGTGGRQLAELKPC